MFAGEIIGRLAQVDGGKVGAFPEFVERRGEAKGDTEVVERIGAAFG